MCNKPERGTKGTSYHIPFQTALLLRLGLWEPPPTITKARALVSHLQNRGNGSATSPGHPSNIIKMRQHPDMFEQEAAAVSSIPILKPS